MDTLAAWAMGEANRGKEMKVFDWDKAAQIIREGNIQTAVAGLSGDMEYTSGDILRNGIPVPRNETNTYLASTWATPVLEVDGDEYPCFKMESEVPGWDEHTYWPESALAILAVEDIKAQVVEPNLLPPTQ